MFKNVLLILFCCFCVSSSLLGQTVSGEVRLLEKVRSINAKNMGEFLDRLDELKKESQLYFTHRKDECSGEFTTFVINEAGEKIASKKKLSSKEKKLCLHSVIVFRIKYTKVIFSARKKYLELLHQEQKQHLDNLEQKSLGELQILSNKYQ